MGDTNALYVDYYALLGIAPAADTAEVRQAYIAKAKQHHPDAGGTNAAMQHLNAAYQTLINPAARAAYDLLHNFYSGTAGTEYTGARRPHDLTDVNDDDIDRFLSKVLEEYSTQPPRPKPSIKQRFKRIFVP